MNRSETINELAAALAKAQGEMRPALKDAENPYFKSNYADLASCWDAVRVPLAKNGLAIVQTCETPTSPTRPRSIPSARSRRATASPAS